LFHFGQSGFVALLQVILIDITLAGDNAVVIGMAASRVPEAMRRRVLFRGLAGAVVLRVILAFFALSLLHQLGLTLAGGILLLWVCWRILRDLTNAQGERAASALVRFQFRAQPSAAANANLKPNLRRAVFQIVFADASMSLDNVLAVAGAAHGHPYVLALGLLLSVALMGVAVTFVARLLRRHPWVSYAGLLIVLYVSITMIVNGSNEVIKAM